MQPQHGNRFQNLLNHKRKPEFHNPRKQFELDRLIQEYQDDLKSERQKEFSQKKKNQEEQTLGHSIKIPPLKAKEYLSKHKKATIQLESLQTYKGNHELASRLRLKTLSTRYQADRNHQKVGSQSIELQPRSRRSQQNKKALHNLRVRNNWKQSSLPTLEQSNNESQMRSKSKEDKGIRWSHRTRKGYYPSDPQKPNQDEYLIKVFKNSKKHLFAVADGHGTNGHLVSQFIIHKLQGHLELQNGHNHIMSLSRTYNKLQDELFKTNLFDVTFSGSTLISAIIEYPKLVCANAGDSRAVLVRKYKQNWEVVHISEDHKPSLPKERKRILKKGGKIHTYKDEQGFSVGPLRVWLPNRDKPGLAMSRSLGDNMCKSIGVTHEPQIVQLQIQAEDKFLIIGSDGVWQNVSSTQILNFLVPLYSQGRLEQCCDTLMHLCVSTSITKPNDPIDDITFIIVFLNRPS